jgi:hypothetical protein
MVPPARPYPLTAPFRELRVLALLAAVSSAATRTAEMALGIRDTLEG